MSNIIFCIKNTNNKILINKSIKRTDLKKILQETQQIINFKIFIEGKEYIENISLLDFLIKNNIKYSEREVELYYENITDEIEEEIFPIKDAYSFHISNDYFIFINKNELNYYKKDIFKYERTVFKKNIFKIFSSVQFSYLTVRPLVLFMHDDYIGTDRVLYKNNKDIFISPLILRIEYENGKIYILTEREFYCLVNDRIRIIYRADENIKFNTFLLYDRNIIIGTTGNIILYNGKKIVIENISLIDNIEYFNDRYLVHSGKTLIIFNMTFSYLLRKKYKENILMIQKNYLLFKNNFHILNL